MSEWDDEPVIQRQEKVVKPERSEDEAPNPIMAEMGKSGGHARAVSLTPERRREIARMGGLARAHGTKKR